MADKPKDGALVAARAQLVELKKYVQDHAVVSIPTNEDALVAEAPVYSRSNAAYIQVPGPYDKGVASTYNIAPPDPKWSRAEQLAYIPSEATLLYTSVHEVWPGHFLQFLHSNANPSKLEGLWVGYGFAEGWAHYCEEMMYEMGLGKDDPAKHIGQIVDALLRDVRLLSAIGLHTEGMTVAQSEKMFREMAFQDPGNARQQAARGTYDPAYLNYTLGKLMIRKLRADWIEKKYPGTARTITRSGMNSTMRSCRSEGRRFRWCASRWWARAAACCRRAPARMDEAAAQLREARELGRRAGSPRRSRPIAACSRGGRSWPMPGTTWPSCSAGIANSPMRSPRTSRPSIGAPRNRRKFTSTAASSLPMTCGGTMLRNANSMRPSR